MRIAFYFIFHAIAFSLQAQDTEALWRPNNKGTCYLYWGWNRESYTRSDITFKGKTHHFTLDNVKAKDRQSAFNADLYFNPSTMTIPQYNFRLGYYFKDKYEISIGLDHMKYVVQNFQTVNINGHISNSDTQYDGTYNNQPLILDTAFLRFEHTDGLNYLNTELRRSDAWFIRKSFNFSTGYGLGTGIMIPRTDISLLKNMRHDKFHIAGYGFDVVGAIKLIFFKHFFIQHEAKFGFIYMPDIRTTNIKSDNANQQFFFIQQNIVFGFHTNLFRHNKTKSGR